MNNGRNEISALPVAALVLSCLGALSFGLFAVPGVICGHLARRGEAAGTNRALAGAGLIVGYVVLALFVGLPLLAVAGALLLSMPVLGRGDLELPWFSGSGAARSEEPGLWESFEVFFHQHGGVVIAGGFVLVLLGALPLLAPRLGHWRRKRQFHRIVMMNRAR